MNKNDGFKIICNKCGSKNISIVRNGVYVVASCDGKDCDNEQKLYELYD
jgi:hypothetical protein